MSKNMLSCRLASYMKYGDQAWHHLPQLGVRYVEAPVPQTAEAMDELERRLRDSGLSAATLQGRLFIQQPDISDQLAPQLEACQRLRVNRLFLSVKREDMPEAQAYEQLRCAGDAAAKAGVILVLETHPDLVTSGTVGAATMRGINHPNVRINFDTANIYFYNHGATAVGELLKVLPWVEAVHLKESTGEYREFNFPPLGHGVVDFPQVVRILNERGFHGPFTMELEGKQGVEFTREEAMGQVEESVNYLRSTGLF